jgi:hypothetical protein
MAEPTAPTLTDALTTGIKLNISGTLPGEALLTQVIAYADRVRATMDPELRTRLDKILVQQMEDLQSLWRGIWTTLGVLPK